MKYNNCINLRKLLLSLCVLCCGVLKVMASHFAAADLYVTYVGAGIDGCTGTTEYKYEVTLEIYKACEPNNVDLPTAVSVDVNSTKAAFTDDIIILTPTIDTLDDLCDAYKSQNSCRVPANSHFPGFVRHTFKAIYTLPSAQTDWVFSWTNGARNSGIQNLQNPSTKDIHVEAGLNNVIRYNNSTPRFLISPLPYICSNQPTNYLNGPYDVNGDSLNVLNIQPMSAANTPIPYVTIASGGAYDYSLNDPIATAANNPYKVNAATGTASFTPTGAGYYVLAFKCEEYDRKTGQVVGYTTRDAQVTVLNCNTPAPSIDTLPLVVSNGSVVGKSVLVCPGSNLNFYVESKTTTTTNQLFMEANTSFLTGSTFAVAGQGTASVKGTFDWTPTAADLGEHTLIITSKDSTCTGQGLAIALKSYATILIRVVKGLDAGKDQPICELNPSPVQLFVKGADFLQSVKWAHIDGTPATELSAENIVNPIASPKTTTEYVVSSPDLKGTCKNSDTVKVFTDKQNTIDIFPQASNYVLCKPGYLQLDVVLTGEAPLNNVSCGTGNPTNCTQTQSLKIYGSSVYGSDFAYDTVGASTPVLYNDVKTARYQYIITRQDLREYGFRSSTIRGLSFETDKSTTDNNFEYSNFTISLKCTNKKNLNKTIGFETGMVQVYKAPGATNFPNGWHKFTFDNPYNWDTTQNLIVEICYSNNPAVVAGCTPVTGTPPIVKFMPTTYISGLSLKAADANVATVCGMNNSAGIIDNAARPVFEFDFCKVPGLPFTYKWSPAPMVSDSSIKSPLGYVAKSTKYSVETFGASGCLVRDTMEVTVPVHNFSVWPDDTSICYGQSAPLEVRNGSHYLWFEYEEGKYVPAHKSLSCDYCANPIAKPLKSTRYKVMVADDVFCYDTIDAFVEVRPNPQVNILTKDTVVKYGQSLQLLVNGGKLYSWTPVASLNNPNISYPIATPTEPTTYVVSGISASGCYTYDTVRVGIDYRDNLLIPSAFSPNGDGRNDVFRATNLTFRRYTEFRVYNRWGQEVYQGTGANAGWDGTWKATPQEMGDYNYLIRVASPDGEEATYKGSVTLIR